MSLFTSLPFLRQKSKNPSQIMSTSWSERKKVLHEDVNLYCWKRSKNTQITHYLKNCLHKNVESLRFTTTSESLGHNLSKCRAQWDPCHCAEADSFWIDIYQLTNDFLALSKQGAGVVHIKIVSDNGCTKFHTDGNDLRLFTTYMGRGTEWLPEKATNRKGLGRRNTLIVKDSSQIQHMDAFEVGILKGESPNNKHSSFGIVHRSPKVDSPDEKRIILRVDV